jgi:hypothetical protein
MRKGPTEFCETKIGLRLRFAEAWQPADGTFWHIQVAATGSVTLAPM